MAARRVLVPVAESITLRTTVGYVVQHHLETAEEPLEIHFVAALTYEEDTPGVEDDIEAARSLLEDVAVWAREDAGDAADRLTVETALIGEDEYLFSPRDFADAFVRYVNEADIELVALDPEYDPGASTPLLERLERGLSAHGVPFEEAPVETPARRVRLPTKASLSKSVSLFGITYIFYLLLGDFTYWYDLVTGFVVAVLVAVTLSQVTFAHAPTLDRSPGRNVRFALYLPYLLVEIIKSNILVAIVILRPSMPIEPRLVRLRARVGGGLPTLALANSITLTPGTLTVEANDQNLLVHTLIPAAREDLIDGGLERAIRFVFYGRQAMAIPSPRERDDVDVTRTEDDT